MKKIILSLALLSVSSVAYAGRGLDCRVIGEDVEAAQAYMQKSMVKDPAIIARECDGQAQLLNILSQDETDSSKKEAFEQGSIASLKAFSTFMSLR